MVNVFFLNLFYIKIMEHLAKIKVTFNGMPDRFANN